MKISETLLPQFDEEMSSTRKLLAVLPEKLNDYKPHPKSMPLNNLAGHIAQLPGWATMTMTTEGLDLDPSSFVPFQPKTRQDVLAEFDKSSKEAHDAIAAASDDSMRGTWSFSAMGKPVFAMPRIAVLRGMVLSHIIHHRAQLGVYLRMLEIEIPGMYGPSADEMKAWEKAAS